MPKRTAHRGPYKARSKPNASMPPLLRRALAQLRGDPPESWPDIGEGFSRHYSFPMWIKMCAPALAYRTRCSDLLAMLARLDRAASGPDWNVFSDRCAAVGCDPGTTMLCTLTDATAPIHRMDAAARTESTSRVSTAARELADAIEAVHASGGHVHDLLPQHLIATESLLATLRYAKSQTVRAGRQIRGGKWQRIALYIAHRLAPLLGIPTAVAIANAATGSRITTKALTKPTKHTDTRRFHVRLGPVKQRN
ncbi:MAG: hypothetical protein M0038_10950 [Pseudomonadota bacterium]|nr:hypothetical protein [Pseudomonadota bacterium]